MSTGDIMSYVDESNAEREKIKAQIAELREKLKQL